MPAVWRRLASIWTAALPSPTEQAVVVGAIRGPADDVQQVVYVAYQGDESDPTMARFTRTWQGAGIGQGRQVEPFEVPCAVVVWHGDDPDPVDTDADGIPDAFDDLLDALFALFNACDAALRADPRLGQAGPAKALLAAGSVVPDPGGLRVRLPFTVQFEGRI